MRLLVKNIVLMLLVFGVSWSYAQSSDSLQGISQDTSILIVLDFKDYYRNGVLKAEGIYIETREHYGIYMPVFWHKNYFSNGNLSLEVYFPYKANEKHTYTMYSDKCLVYIHREMSFEEYRKKLSNRKKLERRGSNFTIAEFDGWYSIHYRGDGSRFNEGFYRNGRPAGKWILYDKAGNVRKIKIYPSRLK